MIVIAQLQPSISKSLLARLRVENEVAIATTEEALWLRADSPKPSCVTKINTLPRLGLFELVETNRLVPLGCRLPTGTLPSGLVWHRLRDWLLPDTLTTCLPGVVSEDTCLPLTITHGTPLDQTANLMLTSLDALHAYVDRAPWARLMRLRFAASGDGRAAVLGEPLLPLPGVFYLCGDRIALPSGYRMEPRLSDKTLAKLLSLAPTEMALFHHDGSFERLRQDDFLQLTRSAVRLTYERFTMEADAPSAVL